MSVTTIKLWEYNATFAIYWNESEALFQNSEEILSQNHKRINYLSIACYANTLTESVNLTHIW